MKYRRKGHSGRSRSGGTYGRIRYMKVRQRMCNKCGEVNGEGSVT
jgi:hypothetical protein